MKKIKPGVILAGMRPELNLGIHRVEQVFESMGFDMWITSVCDGVGVHKKGSRHFWGGAFDCDLVERNPTPATHAALWAQLRTGIERALYGTEFALFPEETHMHIGFYPRCIDHPLYPRAKD